MQLHDVAARIDRILEERRQRLPRVEAELERWQQVDTGLTDLRRRWDDLRGHANAPVEVQGLPDLPTDEIRRDVAEVVELLRVVEARFSRATVNIGVSGAARVGKSTLLQAISGLEDEQIPTGSGQPVTAVRSRIFHSATHKRATLRLHSYRSLVQDVLQPFHTKLGLPEPPPTLDGFRGWKYPATSEAHDAELELGRVRQMQSAIWSYESDLQGDERVVELSDLKPYVAYPTMEQENAAAPCPRRYIAVRDIRIECAFPRADVEHLGITDLPGLGEVFTDAERRHLDGLHNEVDVVLLVKRPTDTSAFFNETDEKVVGLLDQARGFVSRRDFVFIVINKDGRDPELLEQLRDHIRRIANQNEDGRHFAVLEAAGTSQDDVYDNVLVPVLTHLAERLPAMDEATFQGTCERFRSAANRVRALLADVEEALRAVRGSTGTAEDLEKRTQGLLRDVASSLGDLVEELGRRARSDVEDEDYLESVERTYERALGWVEAGLGLGQDVWCEEALRTMRLRAGAAGFAEGELSRVRVEIARKYARLDDFFSGRVGLLWRDAAGLVGRHLGILLDGLDGKAALGRLADLLREASEPCPQLEGAVRELLDLRLDYRTQLHPRVRFELDGLALEHEDPDTGERVMTLELPGPTRVGAEDLYRQVTELAEQAVWGAKKALLLEAVMPTRVLFAAAEQFLDTLVRSGDSEKEFKRFTRSYRDEIWPGAYQGIDEMNARLAAVRRAASALTATVNGAAEVPGA